MDDVLGVRFGAVIDKDDTCCLYTTHIPLVRSKRPDPCCIVRWSTTDDVSITKVLSTGPELLSALAVRYATVTFKGSSLKFSYAHLETEHIMLYHCLSVCSPVIVIDFWSIIWVPGFFCTQSRQIYTYCLDLGHAWECFWTKGLG